MDYRFRPGQLEDQPAIAAFTKDTFEWGDYVADSFAGWVADQRGVVVVAVDENDTAVAMGRASLLSQTEAWYQGARVRKDLRGLRLAAGIAEQLHDWCRRSGAMVARLFVEDWNEPAKRQVTRGGFRPVGEWVMAERAVGEASPVPGGNGGRRVPAAEKLRRARASEAEAAFVSWGSGDMPRIARGLFGIGWSLRRLTLDDVLAAAKAEALWESRAGWAMAARGETTFEVGWLATTRADAPTITRALVDAAVESDSDRIQMMLPGIDWLTNAARRNGCELHPMALYEYGL